MGPARRDSNPTVIVDLLCSGDVPDGGQPAPVPREKRLSALRIPGAHLVVRDQFNLQISGPLLDDRGDATETVHVAGVVPFIVLKALAYDERFEEKDAYDLLDVRGGREHRCSPIQVLTALRPVASTLRSRMLYRCSAASENACCSRAARKWACRASRASRCCRGVACAHTDRRTKPRCRSALPRQAL